MNFKNSEPIYIQLKDFYKKLIVMGVLKNEDPLPSVRDVALENRINPNTVVKAYSILRDEGYIDSLPKKGYFVKVGDKGGFDERLEGLLGDVLLAGYTLDDIQTWVDDKRRSL